jgi:RNA polymerase sigma factor (sigma-70 family)
MARTLAWSELACASGRLGSGAIVADRSTVRIVDVSDFDPAVSLALATKGDQSAWDALVAQYSNLVWAVARSHRLGNADAADVYQSTWLRLVEHIGEIRDGARVGAWLATTARREALALLRRSRRDLPTSEVEVLDAMSTDGSISLDERLLRSEEHTTLWHAFGQLSGRCQQLLRVVFADPPPSYAEMSAALDIPIGSIGPTRARCLGNLSSALSAVSTP